MLDPRKTADEHEGGDCCAVDSRIARCFDGRIAELTADGELPPMIDVGRMLLGLLGDLGARRPTVLELGCGSGALTVELVARGAVRADAVDLSPDMIAAARRRAEEAEVVDRVSFKLGDAALVELERHDWVVLDRVICCYPRVEALLANATRAATERICFTVPTSRGWRGVFNKVAWAVDNVPAWLTRKSCPTFVHDISRIERVLARAGFARAREDRLGLWYAAVWDRAQSHGAD
jgi:magnesium-protoporphyrin O-methyltransferase